MAFARNRGLNVNAKSTVADPLNGGEYLHAFSRHFGFVHDDLIRAGTTKAFWDAFYIGGMETSGRVSRRPVRARLSPPLLRLCPGCLEDDFQVHGCAYFHRAHQLKGIVCPHHGLRLQDSCGSCAEPLRAANEPTIIPMTCRCGSNILDAMPRELGNANWRAFAEFSLAALNSKVGDLDLRHLVSIAACAAVRKHKLSIQESLHAALVGSFGEDGLCLLRSRYGDQVPRDLGSKRKLSVAHLSPSLAIAVVVSCGLTFADTTAAIREQKALEPSCRLVPPGSRGSRKSYCPADVADAREMAKTFGVKKKIRVYRPFVFWMLFLRDRDWLYNWMHEDNPRCATKWDAPPSISLDRALIRGDGSRLHRQAARARAYSRDRTWLESNDASRPQGTDRLAILIDQLKSAKKAHYSALGRPLKWTVASAAKRLRMPHKTLSAFAQREAIIHELVPESASTFLTRVIDWAVAATICEGAPPTATKVLRFANLKGEVKVMRQISAAISERLSFTRTRSSESRSDPMPTFM